MEIFVTVISGGANSMAHEDSFTVLSTHRSGPEAIKAFYAKIDESIKDGGFSKQATEDAHGTFTHVMEEPMDNMDEVTLSHWVMGGNHFMVDEFQCQFMSCTREELK